MLDPNELRSHPDEVAARLAQRGYAFQPDVFGRLDGERRGLIAETDRLKAERNTRSEEIGKLMRQKQDAEPLKARVREIGDEIGRLEEKLNSGEIAFRDFMSEIPNLPHESVPAGTDESANRVERVVGEPPVFAFEPRAHWEIGEKLGILDFERAAKIAGARFAVLKGAGALLERALSGLMLDIATRERGYTEILPPFMANSETLFGTGQLPKFEQDLFKLRDNDYYLIPTAEVPLTNLHAGEILEPGTLPLSYTAHTPCFRSEAGSYGKDVRGLIRQHQFNKVELVKIVEPQKSYEALEQLTGDAEEVLKRLGLAYRVVCLCAGDMGFSAAKTYDIEVWLPGQKAYREISSCSNCTDFQARRANIRYRSEAKGKPQYAHTLNGSGLAVGRTLIAILENYQTADGSVVVPEALRRFAGGLERIG
jgi:seryl-tRNA synthetase